MVNHL